MFRASMSDNHTKFFTRHELASLLKCSLRHIDKLLASGELHCLKVGKLIRIPATELDRFGNASLAGSGK